MNSNDTAASASPPPPDTLPPPATPPSRGGGNGGNSSNGMATQPLSVDGNGYTEPRLQDVPRNPSPSHPSPTSINKPLANNAATRSKSRSPSSPTGKSSRSAASRTPKSGKSATAANSVNPATGPLAHTLCTRLLTDGHVAAFSQAFTLLGLGLPALSTSDPDPSASSATESTTSLNATGPSASASTSSSQHRINQLRLSSSPAHVQRLCTLLTAVEDARARLPPSAPFASSPALWHATRALAVFLTDALPDAAVEYAKQALQVAQKLTDPPTPLVPATPSSGNKPPVAAATVISEEEAKQAVVDAHVLVGNACAQLGMWPAAMVEYRLALSVPEAVERLVYAAMQYAINEEHSPATLPSAIRIYKDTLLCIPPLHPRASTLEMKLRRRLGLAYMSQGDLTAAEVQLTQFLTWTQSHPRPNFASSADWPDDPVGSVSLALAECRELAGDLEGAVIVLSEYMNVSEASGAGGPVREKVAVVLGNLLNRLNRGGAVAGLLKESKGDKAACQLGIARGMEVFDEFMKSVNKSPQDMFRFMDEVRDKYTSGNPPANNASATAAV